MCGLNLGLVSGAHILPVSALGSVDQLTNGLCLCENHHRAFDRHRIWVHPRNRTIKMHPNLLAHAEAHPRSNEFVQTTFRRLAPPQDVAHVPAENMFLERYAYFGGEYGW